jgi:hypothetical protein
VVLYVVGSVLLYGYPADGVVLLAAVLCVSVLLHHQHALPLYVQDGQTAQASAFVLLAGPDCDLASRLYHSLHGHIMAHLCPGDWSCPLLHGHATYDREAAHTRRAFANHGGNVPAAILMAILTDFHLLDQHMQLSTGLACWRSCWYCSVFDIVI